LEFSQIYVNTQGQSSSIWHVARAIQAYPRFKMDAFRVLIVMDQSHTAQWQRGLSSLYLSKSQLVLISSSDLIDIHHTSVVKREIVRQKGWNHVFKNTIIGQPFGPEVLPEKKDNERATVTSEQYMEQVWSLFTPCTKPSSSLVPWGLHECTRVHANESIAQARTKWENMTLEEVRKEAKSDFYEQAWDLLIVDHSLQRASLCDPLHSTDQEWSCRLAYWAYLDHRSKILMTDRLFWTRHEDIMCITRVLSASPRAPKWAPLWKALLTSKLGACPWNETQLAQFRQFIHVTTLTWPLRVVPRLQRVQYLDEPESTALIQSYHKTKLELKEAADQLLELGCTAPKTRHMLMSALVAHVNLMHEQSPKLRIWIVSPFSTFMAHLSEYVATLQDPHWSHASDPLGTPVHLYTSDGQVVFRGPSRPIWITDLSNPVLFEWPILAQDVHVICVGPPAVDGPLLQWRLLAPFGMEYWLSSPLQEWMYQKWLDYHALSQWWFQVLRSDQYTWSLRETDLFRKCPLITQREVERLFFSTPSCRLPDTVDQAIAQLTRITDKLKKNIVSLYRNYYLYNIAPSDTSLMQLLHLFTVQGNTQTAQWAELVLNVCIYLPPVCLEETVRLFYGSRISLDESLQTYDLLRGRSVYHSLHPDLQWIFWIVCLVQQSNSKCFVTLSRLLIQFYYQSQLYDQARQKSGSPIPFVRLVSQ